MNKAIKRVALTKACLWPILVCGLFLLIKEPELTSSFVLKGFEVCVRSVLPALFPFAVLSAVLCNLEAPAFVSRLASKLFGVSPYGACAVISGLLSGFPVGAICVSDLYKSGKISADEAERLVSFTNNPSGVFVIGVVGRYGLGSIQKGMILYLILTAYSIATGIYLRNKADPARADLYVKGKDLKENTTLSAAVKNCSLSMLGICGFIVIFSVVSGYLTLLTAGFSRIVSVLLCGIAELSNGIYSIAESGFGQHLKFALSGLICAFSGISVHMQVSSALNTNDISLKKYYISKVIGALIVMFACIVIGYVL